MTTRTSCVLILGIVPASAQSDPAKILTVSQLPSGQMVLTGSVIDASRKQTVDRVTSTTGGGDAALKAAETLAQQIVQGLSRLSRFSKDKCAAADAWTGTVTYRKSSEINENTPGPRRRNERRSHQAGLRGDRHVEPLRRGVRTRTATAR